MKNFLEFINEHYRIKDYKNSIGNKTSYNIIHEDPSSAKSTGALALLNSDLKSIEFQSSLTDPKGKLLLVVNNLKFLTDQLKKGLLYCEYCNKGPLTIYDNLYTPGEDSEYYKYAKFKIIDGATCDHKNPKSKDGDKTDYSNLAVCCHRCNIRKADKDYDVWIKSLSLKESLVIDEMLLEANMVYSVEFKKILNKIVNSETSSSKIATEILNKEEKFVDINDNYLDVSSSSQMIKLTPDSKVKVDNILFKATKYMTVIPSYSDVVSNLPFDLTNVVENPRTDLLVNKVLKLIDTDINSNYVNIVFNLVEIENENKRVICYYNLKNMGLEAYNTGVTPTEVRLGRFLNRFLNSINYNFVEKDIEDFSNQYQAYFNINTEMFNRFKVVKGEDVRHWYHYKQYVNTGQLAKSCMRDCSEFLDIYCNNEETCSMLILTNEDNKLIGRALLWKIDQGYNFMDRIYTSKDSYIPMFHKWAELNKYEFSVDRKDTVTVKKERYNYYPFMDTFSFFSPTDGKLTSYYLSSLHDLLELSDIDGDSIEY